MSINFAKQLRVRNQLHILCREGVTAIWVTVSLLLIATLASAQPTVQIKEYQVGFPFDITVGPDGAMWFTNYSNIGRITANGTITTFPLPNNILPTKITAGPDGALWFTALNPNAICRITTQGFVTQYVLPNPNSEAWDIVAGPDGALWYSTWAGGYIGRITTDGALTEYSLPRYASVPAITLGPDGAIWFTEINEVGGGGYVGRITANGIITEYLLPPPYQNWAQWGFNGIVTGPDALLWVTDWDYRILRVTTQGTFTEFHLPGCPPCNTGTGDIVVGPDSALWFTLFAGNAIGRITTNGAITQYPIPTLNSQPTGLATGPDGSIWFVEHAAGKIGRVIIQADHAPPLITMNVDPKYIWPANGQMASVIVTGNISDPGSGVAAGSLQYSVVDEYHQFEPSGQFSIDANGNFGFALPLLASVDPEDSNGARYYGVVVRAKDNVGNQSAQWRFAIVTRNQQ